MDQTNMNVTAIEDDKFHEECGVYGVFGNPDAAALTALGLHALQHRGQEACGIVTYSADDDQFYSKRAMGLVDKTFSRKETIDRLPGSTAIGHNRYSTSGDTLMRNIQPLFADMAFGGFGLAHNGNLTNAGTLREELVQQGALFQSTSDTEVILHLMAASKAATPEERLIDALKHVKGAYSVVACTSDSLVAVRDPHGFRPLCMGRLGEAYIFASESCALDIVGAEYVREIDPGEMVVVNKDGMRTLRPFGENPAYFCIFEYIYFARPDSHMNDQSVYEMRKKIGMALAKESPCDVDMVIPVPDSGVPAAIGYAQASNIPFELGIIRNHYIGRTFIEPTDRIRHLGVKMKHNANGSFVAGKKVVLVDDSVVRGTTSKKIVDMMRKAGATEVHMRISAPPSAHSCYYGIDTPDSAELLANKMTPEEICAYIGADSLAYISTDGLYKAVTNAPRKPRCSGYCDACFTGDYPVELTDKLGGRSCKVKVC